MENKEEGGERKAKFLSHNSDKSGMKEGFQKGGKE